MIEKAKKAALSEGIDAADHSISSKKNHSSIINLYRNQEEPAYRGIDRKIILIN